MNKVCTTKLKTINNNSKLETLNSPGKALQGGMLLVHSGKQLGS